jgi:hypothetical protein
VLDLSVRRPIGYDGRMLNLIKALIAGAMIVVVSQVSGRFPRWGALLLALPIVSILALVATWLEQRDLAVISRLSRETLVLVPLGLPLFIPWALADRMGFWVALAAGMVLASVTTGLWLRFGPSL